ncbi:hypothetical protein ACJIZ3_009083 [Penstemon smallii]|uniref:SKP1 component dimerisation domain-containing protein n=1 Tax=Penstemon smallii TaxID=265156 RepID=A0ABD3TBI6_9LAMI
MLDCPMKVAKPRFLMKISHEENCRQILKISSQRKFKIFNIENDFTEEEEVVRNEYLWAFENNTKKIIFSMIQL